MKATKRYSVGNLIMLSIICILIAIPMGFGLLLIIFSPIEKIDWVIGAVILDMMLILSWKTGEKVGQW